MNDSKRNEAEKLAAVLLVEFDRVADDGGDVPADIADVVPHPDDSGAVSVIGGGYVIKVTPWGSVARLNGSPFRIVLTADGQRFGEFKECESLAELVRECWKVWTAAFGSQIERDQK